jgi:hypothetical protein
MSSAGSNLAVGPPQPITGVACMATGAGGQCLPNYGGSFFLLLNIFVCFGKWEGNGEGEQRANEQIASCEWSGQHGTFLGNCCSGYCAATKCRPTS